MRAHLSIRAPRFRMSRRWGPRRRYFFPLHHQMERRRWALRKHLPWKDPRF